MPKNMASKVRKKYEQNFYNIKRISYIQREGRCLLIARYFFPADDYAREVDVTKGY